MTKTAYCYASGQIRVGKRVPKDALPIISGPEKKVRRIIQGTARLARDNKTLLVPGIPEAADQGKALDALYAYIDWIEPRIKGGNKIRYRECTQCGETKEMRKAGICPDCCELNELDKQLIDRYLAEGHTEHCARQLIRPGSECECGVENFELRDPMELLKTINRLSPGRR